MMRSLCTFGLLAGIALGNQSLSASGGVTSTYSTPNRAPFVGLASFYVDLRVHGWSLPGNCQNIGQTPGGVNNPFAVQICPSGQQPGMLRVVQFLDNLGGAGVGLNPPNISIASISFGNPAVLTLAAPLPGTSTPGSKLHIINPRGGGTGCNTLIGDWSITAINGLLVTINADASSCSTYNASSAAAAVDDFVFRWHRDQTLRALVLEAWNVDGTMYTSQSIAATSFGSISLPESGLQFGDPNLSADLAYFRWYGGTIAVGAKAPWGAGCNAGGSCLGDWEFEQNGNDTSGNGMNVTFSSPASYVPSPVYAPACIAGPQQSFRAGTATTLDGTLSFPLDGGSALSYKWQQFASSEPGTSLQSLIWNSQTGAQPVINGLVFGPLNINLTVTQANGQSSSCSVHHGAVATDAADNVVVANAGMKVILGPMQRWGLKTARWPWLDTVTKQWADKLGGLQGQIVPGGLVTNFVASWNNAAQGCTVSATQGSSTLSFSGCNAQTSFCGGLTTPSPSDIYIVAWYAYPISGGGGGTGRRFYQVTGCPSSNTVTINNGSAGWGPATQSGMPFAIILDPDLGSWVGGGSNINYYDNVLALYAMYFRTGIDSYLHYARWLADNWWGSPWTDRGNCKDGQTGWCLFPRISSTAGLFARAVDQDSLVGSPGASPMWSGLRTYIDTTYRPTMNSRVQNAVLVSDLRELSYNDMFVALDALLDPDASRATQIRSELASALTYWSQLRQTDGHWQAFAGTWTNVNVGNALNQVSSSCTVSVMNGSPDVTMQGNGCQWSSSWFTDICSGNPCAEFFSVGNPLSTASRDQRFYVATYTSPTTIRLSQNYEGTTATGRNWLLSSDGTAGSNHAWIGFGTQPFMEGINGWMFALMYHAFAIDPQYTSQAAQARGYMVDAATWISRAVTDGTGGTDPATRGAFYGVGFGQCTPGNDSNGCRCGPNNGNCGSVAASRENMGEALGELARAFVDAPSPALQSAIENVYSACYAKFPADPGYDGTYCQDYDPLNNGFFWASNNGKWLGFMLGVGRNEGWPSARQGGVTSPVNRPIAVGFNLANFPLARQVLVTLTEPAGNTVQATCSTSPCVIQADTTQGNPLLTIAYLSAQGAVLSKSAQPLPFGVQ